MHWDNSSVLHNPLSDVGSEAVTAVTVSWDMTPCNIVNLYARFGERTVLLSSSSGKKSIMEIEAARFFRNVDTNLADHMA